MSRDASILRSIGSKIHASKSIASCSNLLMELRKLCGHPYLLKDVEPTDLPDEEGETAFIAASGKLQLLAKMLPKLKEKGHRVLIFSQFKLVLDILEDFLEMKDYSFCRLVHH